MATKITTPAIEGSTYVVRVTFTNEDGDSLVPNEVLWTLMDSTGEVINSREDVSETPAAVVDITLSGDDLVANAGRTSTQQRMVINATYDSDFGTDLPLVQEYWFNVVNITPVTPP